MIPSSIFARLRCGFCDTHFTADPSDSFTCQNGHTARFEEGFLDFADCDGDDEVTARTFESFGYEWNAFDVVQPEDQEFWQMYFRDVPLEELSGKVGLDAGCGKGRYSYFTANYLDHLVAMDGSSAVRAAVRNLAVLGNVTVVRADLRKAPFAPDSFDFVSCLGVLHHLADPQLGFDRLVDLVAPGGLMLIYIYSRPESTTFRSLGLSAANLLRRLTVRLPLPLIRVASIPIAGLLYLGLVTTGRFGDRVGLAALTRLPLATYRGRPIRSLWLDTFDRLSAPVEFRYTLPELQAWIDCSPTSLIAAREEAGWFLTLRKDTAGK